MALIYLENFDDGAWDQAAVGYLNVTPSGTYGKTGNGIRVGDTPNAYFRAPLQGSSRIMCGFHVYIQNALASSAQGMCSLHSGGYLDIIYDAGQERIGVRRNISSTGSAYVYGDSYTVSTGQWHYVEFQIYANVSSLGTIDIAVDGDLQLEATGLDFYSPTIDEFEIGQTGSTDCNDFYVDDIYSADNTGGVNDAIPIGPIDVVTLLPDGNGNSSDLVGQDTNSTDNYLNVDEASPDDGTTYNGSGTEGDLDTYTMDDLSGTPTIVGATVRLNAAKTDTGAKYIRPVVRTGSLVDYTTTPTITASTTFSTYTAGKAWRTATDYWVSATVSATEWWKADFGSTKDFGSIDFHVTPGGTTYPTTADLEYSDNDSDWYAAADQLTGITVDSEQTIDIDFDVGAHRYWRITFGSFSGSSGMELDAVYFYEVTTTAADVVGDSAALAEGYDAHDAPYDLNPGTGKLWTYTTLNAAEFGAEVRDS